MIAVDEQNEIHLNLTATQSRVILSKSRFVAMGGGVRNGKSTVMMLKIRQWVMERENTHGVIGRWDATDLDASTIKDWFTLFPTDEMYYNHSTRVITLPGNRRIDFKHFSQLNKLTNMTLDWFWIEQAEECTFNVFTFMRLRISKEGGHGAITFNPANGEDWIYYLFGTNEEMRNAPKGEKHSLTGRLFNPSYDLFMAPTDENAANLDAAYMADLDELPEDIAQRMRHGEFVTSAAKVYPEFSRKNHIVTPFEIPEWWIGVRAIDWGRRNPFVCAFLRFDEDGNCFVQDTYFIRDSESKNLDVADHVKEINRRSVGVRWIGTILDTACWAETQTGNRGIMAKKGKKYYSIADEFEECGLVCEQAQKNRQAGIERVKRYLKWDARRLHPISGEPGAPRLFILNVPNNAPCITQMIGYSRRTYGSRMAEQSDQPEEPLHKECDFPDALRYGLMFRPGKSIYERPTPEGSIKDMIEQIQHMDMEDRRHEIGV